MPYDHALKLERERMIQTALAEPPKWYAVVTEVRQEKRAALSIMDALKPRDPLGDLAVYLPCEIRWISHAGKGDYETRPLFKRYLFALIRQEHIHLVRSAEGVEDFVRSAGVPMALGPRGVHELMRLRDMEADGAFDASRQTEIDGPWMAGDCIKVAVGKWADWPGRVLKMTTPERVLVLLSMFGKEHEKELEASQLRAA